MTSLDLVKGIILVDVESWSEDIVRMRRANSRLGRMTSCLGGSSWRRIASKVLGTVRGGSIG